VETRRDADDEDDDEEYEGEKIRAAAKPLGGGSMRVPKTVQDEELLTKYQANLARCSFKQALCFARQQSLF
jgi:hypothetical protein